MHVCICSNLSIYFACNKNLALPSFWTHLLGNPFHCEWLHIMGNTCTIDLTQMVLIASAFCGMMWLLQYGSWSQLLLTPWLSTTLPPVFTQLYCICSVEVVCSALLSHKALSVRHWLWLLKSCSGREDGEEEDTESSMHSLLSLPDTLQSSCSGDYDLWRSLHVVRTWGGSLASAGRERESEHSPLSLVLLLHTYLSSSYFNFCL